MCFPETWSSFSRKKTKMLAVCFSKESHPLQESVTSSWHRKVQGQIHLACEGTTATKVAVFNILHIKQRLPVILERWNTNGASPWRTISLWGVSGVCSGREELGKLRSPEQGLWGEAPKIHKDEQLKGAEETEWGNLGAPQNWLEYPDGLRKHMCPRGPGEESHTIETSRNLGPWVEWLEWSPLSGWAS